MLIELIIFAVVGVVAAIAVPVSLVTFGDVTWLEILAHTVMGLAITFALILPLDAREARASRRRHRTYPHPDRTLSPRTRTAARVQASSPITALRWLAARSHIMPANLLVQLANDPSPRVRRQVAGNWAAPAGALAVLASDERVKIRDDAAKHLGTPDDALVALMCDSNGVVRWHAATLRNAKKPLERASLAGSLEASQRLAMDTTTSVSTLMRLASHDSDNVRAHVCYNRSTPRSVLERLADDANEGVRNSAQTILAWRFPSAA